MTSKRKRRDEPSRTDVLSPAQRRYCMSQIKSRDTKPEVLLRKAIWRRGYRYRKATRVLGKPDIVLPAHNTVVFVDGCFWHGCPKHSIMPKSNSRFWKHKLAANKKRDAYVTRTLRREGWKVVRVWEHEVTENIDRAIARIESVLEK